MKILHVITRSDLGGAQTVVINLANAMCKDHEIIVVAGEDGPMWDALDSRILKIKVNEILREISPVKDFKAFQKLRKIYLSLQPDVVHLHSSKIGVLGRLAFPPNKIVYSIHGFDSIRLAYRRFLPFEKFLKNRCKAIVLASDYDRKNIIKEGIENNLYVIYNGVHKPYNEQDIKINGLEGFTKVVMCIARISPQKRFESFLQIAAMLPKYAFVWIGTEKTYPNLPPNVFCLPRISNAQKYIQLSDLFILPSNYEGVPIVLINALSYGKPVVSSNVGGISEIIRDHENGFVLKNIEKDFADKIEYILENESIYKNFSEKSFKIFTDSFSIDEMVKQYLKIYKLAM